MDQVVMQRGHGSNVKESFSRIKEADTQPSRPYGISVGSSGEKSIKALLGGKTDRRGAEFWSFLR